MFVFTSLFKLNVMFSHIVRLDKITSSELACTRSMVVGVVTQQFTLNILVIGHCMQFKNMSLGVLKKSEFMPIFIATLDRVNREEVNQYFKNKAGSELWMVSL